LLDQGGDSLTVTRLVSRIRDRFGVELTIDDVLDNASVDGVAHLVKCALAPPETATIQPQPQSDTAAWRKP
jgi:acyl carrier protein